MRIIGKCFSFLLHMHNFGLLDWIVYVAKAFLSVQAKIVLNRDSMRKGEYLLRGLL